MRDIAAAAIEQAVRDLCIEANRHLPGDIRRAVQEAAGRESMPLARDIMRDLEENLDAADELCLPVCQDTGMAVVFARLGQEAHITGGLLRDAVNRGVARGYTEGLLRCSVVKDPLRRVNTGDNTPAVLHVELVEGDRLDPDPYYAEMERDALASVNALGIGPQGFGGATTCLGVAIETYPTHIAGLPVAVNVGCHVTRHASVIL